MEIQRIANAGVLLRLDGVSILLDGLCDRVDGYLPTPPHIVEQLLDAPPDLLAFTHCHADHCSQALLLPYQTYKRRPILGPASLPAGQVRVGDVGITAVETRHLGKAELGLVHMSYVIEGSKTVWFMGDASPMQLKKLEKFPRPDVLIAPYAYANTVLSWAQVMALSPKTVVIVHLPEKEQDFFDLRHQVEETAGTFAGLWLPEIEECKNV
ncbi:MAG: MBL fold metallo-hydrolase [Ruminococcaceae bacterium]|nr:MBL fold metallo-hydrolase [Oscillospiraceae bacterium]